MKLEIKDAYLMVDGQMQRLNVDSIEFEDKADIDNREINFCKETTFTTEIKIPKWQMLMYRLTNRLKWWWVIKRAKIKKIFRLRG